MSSFTRRLTITAVTVAIAATSLLAATTPASAACLDANGQQVGPLLVQASSENTSRVDVCSQIDLGTYWEGIDGHTGKFGILNFKYADNKFFALHIEDVMGLGLGSSDQNPTGTFG
ncbi:hypothetical protein CGLAR1_08765 [Corynebacterium glutamicum]|uniref:hypothetical protein n=1 Tax=Corynebacterium glutamicum TaxID=1718 RepID=UPI0004F78374|nr:hypothetical protein [Corynebacterium glutamicum]AIK85332.1 hypothetical protein CGLAR1_08765 [Corynebacterium glutamicum]AIK88117.1 hypothetical protein AR0_08915 [Corynebacterium glutamicum]QDQ21107.1 hypothetical protein FOL53_10380 [Corynebacterium glutamicum]QDQ22145.1 hypothetical protein FOY32_00350 [Corynebacterium glutamicum]